MKFVLSFRSLLLSNPAPLIHVNERIKNKVIIGLIIGSIIAGLITILLAVKGVFSYLWMLLLLLLFKRKRIVFHGILSTEGNRYVEVKTTQASEGLLAQDVIDTLTSPAEILNILRESGDMTLLPTNAKMTITAPTRDLMITKKLMRTSFMRY